MYKARSGFGRRDGAKISRLAQVKFGIIAFLLLEQGHGNRFANQCLKQIQFKEFNSYGLAEERREGRDGGRKERKAGISIVIGLLNSRVYFLSIA